MMTLETLPSGLRLAMEHMPSMRSVSVGVWAITGSRHESPEQAGISHFVEHLVFKGTERRTDEEIAIAIDSVGGDLNAETERETTSYFARVADTHIELAVDLLSDLVIRPAFDQESIETELQVVAEEIKRWEDTPNELVHDHFCQVMWPNSGVGRLVTGDIDCLSRLTATDLRAFLRSRYTADNLVVSVAGRFKAGEVRRMVARFFAEVPPGPSGASSWEPAAPCPGLACATRDLEQVHLVVGWPGCCARDERRYVQAVLDSIFGASSSSRIVREVREERGLAYSIWSEPLLLLDTGALTAYVGTSADTVGEVLAILCREAAALAAGDAAEEEVARGREQFKGSTALALESTDSRESRNARGVITLGRLSPYDDLVAATDRVGSAEVAEFARGVFDPSSIAVAAIGPIERAELGRLVAEALA